MTTKSNKKKRRIQMLDVNRKKVNIHLPIGTTEAGRRNFKSRASRLVNAERNEFELSSQDQKWLDDQSKEIKEKLRLLGVGVKIQSESELDQYKVTTVIREFFRERDFKAGSNEDKYIRATTRIEKYSRKNRISDIRDFTLDHALKFARWLVEKEGLDENSTARRTNGYVNTVFQFAFKKQLTEENVFATKQIPKKVLQNEDKFFFISPHLTKKIFSQLKTDEDKLRFVLMRYLGLRSPSEMNELSWSDFDWKDGLVTIRSPKLINHPRKYRRQCAFRWPEAIKVISDAYDNRLADSEKILPRLSHKNLTKHVKGWLGKAGVNLWPDLLQNFRRTAITEACEIFPSHVVASYFGHSEVISMTHYRMVHADYAKRLEV